MPMTLLRLDVDNSFSTSYRRHSTDRTLDAASTITLAMNLSAWPGRWKWGNLIGLDETRVGSGVLLKGPVQGYILLFRFNISVKPAHPRSFAADLLRHYVMWAISEITVPRVREWYD
jgi:hypothetical protein